MRVRGAAQARIGRAHHGRYTIDQAFLQVVAIDEMLADLLHALADWQIVVSRRDNQIDPGDGAIFSSWMKTRSSEASVPGEGVSMGTPWWKTHNSSYQGNRQLLKHTTARDTVSCDVNHKEVINWRDSGCVPKTDSREGGSPPNCVLRHRWVVMIIENAE